MLVIGAYGRDQRESRKNLDLDNFWLVSRNLGLDNLEIVVSTESRSRQLTNHESRANLDLDNFENLSLVQVSISTIFRFFILESRFFKNSSDVVKVGLLCKI